jgi:hypothetical protein
MSRWQAAVAVVALFVSAGISGAVIHRHREACGTAAPVTAAVAAPGTDWLGGWDWACPCAMSYGYAAFAIAGESRTDTAPPPPAPGPGPGPTARPPVPPAGPPKLHVLILVDDANKDAGPANKAGAVLLEKTLRGGVSADRLGSVETLAGSAVTADRIRSRLSAFGVRSNDTVVGFYSGAMESDDASRSPAGPQGPAHGSAHRRPGVPRPARDAAPLPAG